MLGFDPTPVGTREKQSQCTTGKTGPVVLECRTVHSSHGLACLHIVMCDPSAYLICRPVSRRSMWWGSMWQVQKYVMWYSKHHPLLPPHLWAGPNIKTVTRINSMPNIGSRARQEREKHAEQNAAPSQSPSTSRVPLEVGSMVEVVSNSGITVYGVVRWLGVLAGKSDEWAGIELVRHSKLCCLQASTMPVWLFFLLLLVCSLSLL